MPPDRHRTLRFDDFALDLQRGCLRRGEAEIRLRPKSFDVLRYLAENPQRLISKEELVRAAWPNAFVTDNSLVQCLIEIRRAVGDHAQTMIRTVPRRGYIFDVPVTASDRSEDSPLWSNEAAPRVEVASGIAVIPLAAQPDLVGMSDAPAESRGSVRSDRKVYFITIAVMLASVALAGAFDVGGIRERLFARPALRGIRSIVVLPVEGLSSEAELDYFADGMTDALITNLAQIEALRVISRTTAMQYKKPRKPLPQIARELDVDAVVEGTATRSGNRVRISAQLVLARADQHVWAKSYEGDLQNVLGLQDEVARDIADEIKVKVTPMEKALFTSAPSVNPEAYDAYLKSRQFILGGRRTSESARKSLNNARHALALQPGSALLLANLADALITMNFLGGGSPREVMPEAKSAAERAVRIDETIGSAHYALAMVHFNYDWDFRAADREFARALRLEPNAAETRSFHGFYLSAMGRHDEAVKEMRRGLELDPLSTLQNRNLGSALYYARRYDEAVAQFEHTAALDPNFPVVYNWLAWVFQARGMDAPAVDWGLKDMAANGVSPAALTTIRSHVATGGPRAYWGQLLERQRTVSLTQIPGALAYQLAAAAVHVGQTGKAMEYLRRALDDRAFWIPFVNVDPRFDDLHAVLRFQELLDDVGLQP